MRKSTIKYAKTHLTCVQFKAWQNMSPRLSKSEIKSGKRPPGTSTKLSPGKAKQLTAALKKPENKAALLWYERKFGKAGGKEKVYFLELYQENRANGDSVNTARDEAAGE